MHSDRLIEAAQSYTRHGFSVLPCKADKSPDTRHGLKDAMTDPAEVARTWNGSPALGILAPAEVLVLDLDDPAKIADMVARYPALREAPTVRTPRGGRHYYLRLPDGTESLSARVGALPGVDLRGMGKAYTIAPPSPGYEWSRPLVPVDELPLVPAALLEAVKPPKTERRATPPRNGQTSSRDDKWASTALEQELDAVRSHPPGGRNHRLNEAAFSLGQLVGGGHLDEHEAIELLVEAALGAGLGESEARKTIASGMSSGKRDPRQKPPRMSTPGPSATTGTNTDPEPPTFGIIATGTGYAIEKKGVLEHLTNWTFEPLLRLRYPGGNTGERGVLLVNGSDRHTVELPSEVWNSRKDLLTAIGTHGAVNFSTNNSDVAKIRQTILLEAAGLPIAGGVKTYGLMDTEAGPVALFEDGALCDSDQPPVFYAGTPVDPGSRAHATPKPGTTEQVEAARAALLTLPKMISKYAALAMMGYAVASAYSPRITAHLGRRLPFLFIAGEREGGKTSAAQLLLHLATGDDSARLYKASGLTPYQYDLAVSNINNLLTVIDEYKPGLVDDAQIRKHHDLAMKWRGSGIAAKDHSYHLTAPTVIMGEGFTEDAAALSRGVLYYVEKMHRGPATLYAEALAAPLSSYAYHLHETARSTPEAKHRERIEQAEELARKITSQAQSPRLVYGLTYIGYGLLALKDEVPGSATLALLEIEATLEAGARATLEDGTETKTNLEAFLEQLGAVALEHKDPRALIVPGARGGEIIIRISPAIEAVRKVYRKDAAIANTRLLRQYAKGAEWADASGTHKAIGADVVRGVRILLREVPERCDISALEHIEAKLRRNYV